MNIELSENKNKFRNKDFIMNIKISDFYIKKVLFFKALNDSFINRLMHYKDYILFEIYSFK